MTNTFRRASASQVVEEVARLIEESSLGTAGARQLRDRGSEHANVIRARAYFAASSTGRAWWQANQRSPEALRAKSLEFVTVDPGISDALARLADDAQEAWPACSSATGSVGRPQIGPTHQETTGGWISFENFYKKNGHELTAILCQQADLPASLGSKLIFRAMVEAFDDWEQLISAGDPGEWVVGRALQLYRASRRGTPPGGECTVSLPLANDPRGSVALMTCADDVRVTGALAVAASRVEVSAVPAAARDPQAIQCWLEFQIAAESCHRCMAEEAVRGASAFDYEADRVVTALYSSHYRSLVRMAALLVRDVATAEEVVQDSFIALHAGWGRLRDTDKALSYLRQSVVNRARSVLRHRVAPDGKVPERSPDVRSTVVSALRSLPPRQREALVLRYYGDMSEAQIAVTMGISRGAVKGHTALAMSALRKALERGG